MRTGNEIFEHHLEVFGAGDIEGILKDYDDASIMVYGNKTWIGLAGAKDFFTMWLDDLIPSGSDFCVIDQVAVENMVYITWTANSRNYVFDYATNTFIFRNDKIWRQTVATHHRVKI